MLDHLPPFLHVVITTRADPPLKLSYRHGRSEVNQIRAADLAFSSDESAEFLNEQMRLDLPRNDIETLGNRTEGWIAGLQLAALSLQEQANKHKFVLDFAGDDRYIADYLIDEVLQSQPAHIQDFLLKTSILNQLSGPLCKVLTGQSESQTILDQLEHHNLFLSPLDNRREWYRYHSLFADLLRQRVGDSFKE
jgi:LuxR family maltose regulon positive regulatory protein